MFIGLDKMAQYIFEISDIEEKILLTDVLNIQEYFDYAIRNKVRHTADEIIKPLTDRQVKKIPLAEKFDMIRPLDLETAAERTQRLEDELSNL